MNDIEIVKSIIKSEKFDLEVEEKYCIDKDTYKVKGIKNRISALENVLKKLEIKDKMNNILAKEVKDLFYGMVNELCDYETGYSINKDTDTTIENILDWARKEVEK